MELPLRFLVLILLIVIAVIAMFMVLNPIQSGSVSAQQAAERGTACSNWSMDSCSSSSGYLQGVKKAFGCAGADECKQKCLAMRYCLTS